jgi:hypothetical protein
MIIVRMIYELYDFIIYFFSKIVNIIKAKTMNFSIAYGKTAHGFSKDWGCSIEEAEAALEAWYSDR